MEWTGCRSALTGSSGRIGISRLAAKDRRTCCESCGCRDGPRICGGLLAGSLGSRPLSGQAFRIQRTWECPWGHWGSGRSQGGEGKSNGSGFPGCISSTDSGWWGGWRPVGRRERRARSGIAGLACSASHLLSRPRCCSLAPFCAHGRRIRRDRSCPNCSAMCSNRAVLLRWRCLEGRPWPCRGRLGLGQAGPEPEGRKQEG